MEGETAGVPNQLGPNPVHKPFGQRIFLVQLFILDQNRILYLVVPWLPTLPLRSIEYRPAARGVPRAGRLCGWIPHY